MIFGKTLMNEYKKNGQKLSIQIERTFCPIQKMTGRDKNGRANSRTICQQNRIAFTNYIKVYQTPFICIDSTKTLHIYI